MATTIDHQPGRVFFNKRRWPEGFAFPACEQCNNVSRDAERVMAILIHGECDNEDRGKFQKNLASVRRDFPGLVDSMIPKSTNEVRRILRKKNISREPWETFSEVPLVKLKLDHWQNHIDIFSRKILLALHYQCFGRPLHSKGLLWFLSFTNFYFASGEFPQKLIELAKKLAIPLRQNQNLGDQFSVLWNNMDDRDIAIFTCHFHSRFMISGITTADPTLIVPDHQQNSYGPFDWQSPSP